MANEISDGKSTPNRESGVIGAGVDFFQHLGHAAIVQPAESVSQLFDELRGKPTEIKAPESKDESFAAKAGDMIGSAIPFVASAVLLHKFVPLTAESKLVGFGAGAALGFGYSGLFNPVYGNNNNFWESKLHNAAVSGLTVGTMSMFRSPLATDSRLTNFTNGSLTGFKAGLAGGLVNAEADSLLNGQLLASPDKLFARSLTFGFTGAAFGGIGGAMTKSEGTNANERTNDAQTSRPEPLGATQLSASHDAVERMPPIIARDPEDGAIFILDSGRTASFKDGTWQPGVLFLNGRIMDDFRDVSDPAEIARLMQQASEALRKSEKP